MPHGFCYVEIWRSWGRLLLAVFVRLKSSSNAKVWGLAGTALHQGSNGSQQPTAAQLAGCKTS